MIRKCLCVALAVLSVVVFAPFASASPARITDSVPVPVIAASGETVTATDRVISLSYTARWAEVEAVRETLLQELLATRTREEIAASDAAWILRETTLFCEASPDGRSWYTVTTAAEENGTLSLSLFEDILPALAAGGAELNQKIYGFDYRLRLRVASDDYSPRGESLVFAAGAPSEEVTFSCPEFTCVDCVLPDDAVMERDFPMFMYYPNEKELKLPYPTREGYFFAGWLKWDGGYTETVPAGSRYFRVTAQWDPRTYAVNYVLSTNPDPRFSYSFGRANNSANPTRHTVGESATLYKLKSPVGGFSFDGWYLTEDFSGERLACIPADLVGDIILYAKWAPFEELEARDKEEKDAYVRSLHYGDLDDDGEVTAGDARLTLRVSVGLEKDMPLEMVKRADIFDSGVITPDNARSILRVAVGLDSLYDILKESGIIKGNELDT